jgi:hypothetical protein
VAHQGAVVGSAVAADGDFALLAPVEEAPAVGCLPEDHFRGVTKMVKLGSSAKRTIEDFMRSRYACYFIVQDILLRQGREAWPDAVIVQQAVGQLPWGHNLALLTKPMPDAPLNTTGRTMCSTSTSSAAC